MRWVAEVGGGVIVGAITVDFDKDDVPIIHDLLLDSAWRGRSISDYLIEAALNYCWDHAVKRVALAASIDHKAAIRLFRGSGFHYQGTRFRRGRLMMEFHFDLYCNPNPGSQDESADRGVLV